jgi:hypothetical protein
LSKKEQELRDAAFIIDLFLTIVLLAVYREDYSFSMFVLTMPIAVFLGLAWLEIIRSVKQT